MAMYGRNGARLAFLMSLAIGLAGCSSGVREDRTIDYSSDGADVAFQHGDEGVFVASADGAMLVKIFDSAQALAVSSPLWSPIDKRLVFTSLHPNVAKGTQAANETASLAERKGEVVFGNWDENPEGRRFLPGQVLYTCWLREEPTGEGPAEPRALFTARCNHAGYVGANLAVRWHPAGQKVVYLDLLDDGQMGLFEFELSTGNKRQISPRTGAGLVFDWSPGGSYLTCSVVGNSSGTQADGTWVVAKSESGGAADAWWQLPHSERFAVQVSFDLLEVLRTARPVWSTDERALAFIAMQPVNAQLPSVATESKEGAQLGSALYVADVASRQVAESYRAEATIRDVRWHPDGKRVGFVEGAVEGKLRIAAAASDVAEPLQELAIRQFVGWNATGDSLSIVSPIPEAEYQHRWALLFPSIAQARDRVYIVAEKAVAADGVAEDGVAEAAVATDGVAEAAVAEAAVAGKLVHDGMRISFPKWSPTENKLSLWGTFTPSHRCWSAVLLPWSLRPGDPAAVWDGASGELNWLAVSPQEKSQVGHFYLLKQEYARAWEWYEQGAMGREPPKPLSVTALWSHDQLELPANEPWFYEYYCLSKLGRTLEAEARLQELKMSMRFANDPFDPTVTDFSSIGLNLAGDDATVAQWQQELGKLVDLVTPLLPAIHACEVFLSLNAASDGVGYFQSEWNKATSDSERFACGLGLTQMQLASGAHAEYAAFVTEDFLPVVERLLGDRPLPESFALPTSNSLADWRTGVESLAIGLAAGLSILPLGSQEFMATLEEDQVLALLPKWQEMASRSPFAIDVAVMAMQERLREIDAGNWQRAARPTFLSKTVRLSTPQEVDQLILLLSELPQHLFK